MTLIITRGDGLISTAQAAELAGRKPSTIRKWVQRKRLKVTGLDEHGNSLFDPRDVAEAEKRVRDNGIRSSGIDPRRPRFPPGPMPAAA